MQRLSPSDKEPSMQLPHLKPGVEQLILQIAAKEQQYAQALHSGQVFKHLKRLREEIRELQAQLDQHI